MKSQKMTHEEAEFYWDVASRHLWKLKASKNMTYHGLPILKNPLDLWSYQDIIWRLKPGLIVEFGTWHGGSAMWLAHQMDSVGGAGRVVTVDIAAPARAFPKHSRLVSIKGDSLSQGVFRQIEAYANESSGPVMFIEDSCHSTGHVLAELTMYAPLVTRGSYIIVEDVKTGTRKGVQRFLAHHPDFKIDRACEGFRITNNKGGYLRRV